jgi:hypothetical protein
MGRVWPVDQEFDVNSMIERFRERAAAVRQRGLPPVEGPERQRILRQMKLDFQDFAMVGDAEGSLENGVLTLRLDLRPKPESEPAPASGPETEGGDPGEPEPEGGDPGEPEPEPEPPAAR